VGKLLNILYRTAGGKGRNELGYGHIVRCINLAKYLKGHRKFFVVEDYGDAARFLKNRGIKQLFILSKGIDSRKDFEETKKIIKRNRIDILVIDRYKISLRYLHEIKKMVKTVVISDLNKIQLPGNLVINGFIGYKNSIKRNKFGTKCLLGPQFQILDEKFATNKKKVQKKFDVLITLGGNDENNIIEYLMKRIIKYNLKTRIILGPSTKKSKNVLKLESCYPKKFSIIKKTNNMFKEISSSKFGICAGGITSYEFASVGVPFAIICQVRHQLITAKVWEEKHIATNLGMYNKNSNKIDTLFNYLDNKKLENKTKNYPLIDGKGIIRVSKEILDLALPVRIK
jgi:spore coat polysaccharide biosynthesis predicted glycosyltransferase SpsG